LKTLENFNGGGKVDKGKRIYNIYINVCAEEWQRGIEREKTIVRHISRRKME